MWLYVYVDDVFLALSDRSRRAILAALRDGPATAGELGRDLPISQPATSKHLRVLRDAQLVTVTERGRQRVYALAPEPLHDLERWLAPYRDLWLQRMDALATEVARGRRGGERSEADTDTDTDTDTDQECA